MGTSPVKLTGNQVVDIFARRAGGATQEEIAADYPFSTAIVADVLHRRKRADVPIPPEILEAVQKKYKAPQKRRTTCPPPNPPLHEVLAQFTASVHEMNTHRRRCKQAGLDPAALDVLMDMILDGEGVNGDGTG